MCEIHAEPRSLRQDKRRRINNIHNRSYFDTVEVIGSIPVAPTTLSTLVPCFISDSSMRHSVEVSAYAFLSSDWKSLIVFRSSCGSLGLGFLDLGGSWVRSTLRD